MEYKILICDDDEHYRKDIEYYVKEAADTIGIEVEIFICISGEECLRDIEQKEINLLFLDVDMPDMTGLDVARKLREEQNDLLIVFVSSYPEYVFASFEVEAFRFIRKEQLKIEILLVLRAAVPKMKLNIKKYIQIKSDSKDICIALKDILYIELIKRKLYFCLVDEKIHETKMTINEIEENLEGTELIFLHRGLIVNVRYVDSYSKQEVSLKSGKKFPVARTRAQQVKKTVYDYWSTL